MESNQHSSSFDGEALGNQIVAAVRSFVSRSLEYALVNYSGPYQAGKAYPAGALVAHENGVWRASYKTASTPGEGQAWTRWQMPAEAEQ